MYRYFVFIWRPFDPQEAQAAAHLTRKLQSSSRSWRCAWKDAGIAVYQAGEEPGVCQAYQLPQSSGVVLGTLFHRGAAQSTPAAAQLAASEIAIASSGGRHLLEHYWGRYIAVMRAPGEARTMVLRDPSGAMACSITQHQGVHLLFSGLEDCLELGLKFSVDWSCAAALAVNRDLQIPYSGLAEVAELLPGEALEIEQERVKRTLLWDPFSVARREPIEDPERAAQMMRVVARDCIQAWASLYPRILLRLSGGLDSSIVLSALNERAPGSVVCVNYFSTGLQEDEREFARASAQRRGCELLEEAYVTAEVSPQAILQAACKVRSSRPRFYWYELACGHREIDLARARGAAALWDGSGGDALFYQSHGALAVADFALRRGLRPKLFSVALDAAHVDRLWIGSVLKKAFQEGLRRQQRSPLEELLEFKLLFNRELLEPLAHDERFSPPWMTRSASVPPGKRWHVFSLSTPLPLYDSTGREDESQLMHPLLSQPLIELCLRIPTDVMISGGWDRSIARRAFAQDVPRQIIRRRSKGAVSPTLKNDFERYLPKIREVLLEGLMVRHGILDKRKLEEALSPKRDPKQQGYGEILFDHLSTEAWLRSWVGVESSGSLRDERGAVEMPAQL